MLFMAGVNGTNRLDYPDQPNIYAVAMTDENDLARSTYGSHVDFAAPGYEIYSTTIDSGYAVDSGTSFSAPLLAGIAAWVMSVNPKLGPDEIDGILIASCVDLGAPGRDEHYGWGRINFAEVARRAFATLPASRIGFSRTPFFTVSARIAPGAASSDYTLFRTDSLLSGNWEQVPSPLLATNGAVLYMTDPATPGGQRFYKIQLNRGR
jgi:subtilisin family serine protease